MFCWRNIDGQQGRLRKRDLINFTHCSFQVLQDMGLPTGVELKTAEAVKPDVDPAPVQVPVEEPKPVVPAVEPAAAAATGAANTDAVDAAEV